MNEIEEFEAQGTLQPGEYGWWRVWGAFPRHIRPGDIVLMKQEDGSIETWYVEDTFRAKAHPIRVGIVINGERQTIGALAGPMFVIRRGTKNTLAEG